MADENLPSKDTGPLYDNSWKFFQSPQITGAIHIAAPIDVAIFNDPHALHGVIIRAQQRRKQVIAQLVSITPYEIIIQTPLASPLIQHIFPLNPISEPVNWFNPKTCGVEIMFQTDPRGGGIEVHYHYVPQAQILQPNHHIHQI